MLACAVSSGGIARPQGVRDWTYRLHWPAGILLDADPVYDRTHPISGATAACDVPFFAAFMIHRDETTLCKAQCLEFASEPSLEEAACKEVYGRKLLSESTRCLITTQTSAARAGSSSQPVDMTTVFHMSASLGSSSSASLVVAVECHLRGLAAQIHVFEVRTVQLHTDTSVNVLDSNGSAAVERPAM